MGWVSSTAACLLVCSPSPSTLTYVLVTFRSYNEILLCDMSRYYQVENTQEDILNRVFLILWINAFNSCKDRSVRVVTVAHGARSYVIRRSTAGTVMRGDVSGNFLNVSLCPSTPLQPRPAKESLTSQVQLVVRTQTDCFPRDPPTT